MRRAGKSRWEVEVEERTKKSREALQELLREFMPGWEVVEVSHDRDILRDLEVFGLRIRINVDSHLLAEQGLDKALRGATTRGPEDKSPYIEDDEAELPPSADDATGAE